MLPVDEHTIRLRDLRKRFGEPELWAAECRCGWLGEPREGLNAARSARRDGMRHCEVAASGGTAPSRDYYEQG
jgi:hypothetical protein